jgi:hypothetical protein
MHLAGNQDKKAPTIAKENIKNQQYNSNSDLRERTSQPHVGDHIDLKTSDLRDRSFLSSGIWANLPGQIYHFPQF